MSRLLLLRHGQSEWNAVGRWQGRADPPLSALGRRQSEAAARRLGSIEMVATSPLIRAAETATILAEALGVGPTRVVAGLQERDAGEWTGLTRSEIEERWPGHLDNGERPPGYEPDETVHTRVTSAVQRLHEDLAGGSAVAVTHAGVIYTLEDAVGLPFERIPNLSGRWLEIRAGALRAGDRVDLLADATIDAPVPDLL